MITTATKETDTTQEARIYFYDDSSDVRLGFASKNIICLNVAHPLVDLLTGPLMDDTNGKAIATAMIASTIMYQGESIEMVSGELANLGKRYKEFLGSPHSK